MTNLGNDWDLLLKEETEQPYMEELRAFLREEYRHYNIYPPKGDMFRALKLTPYADVKAVIIGQDPYHGAGQAMGMSFSVRDGVRIPPSLQNIYKEIEDTTGRKAAGERRSDPLGGAGGAAVKCGLNRARGAGRKSPRPRLGTVYGFDYLSAGQKGKADCVFALGCGCAEKARAYTQSGAYGFNGGASKPVFRL